MRNRHSRLTVRSLYVLIDIICAYLCIFAACRIRESSLPFDVTFSGIILGNENPFRSIFILWIILIVIFARTHQLYQTRRDILEGYEIWRVLKAVTLAGVCTVVAIYALKIEGLPRSVILSGSAIMAFVLSLWRLAKRILIEYLVINGYNNINVLIIGAGKVGTALALEIKKHPGLGLKVVGFLDDLKKTADQDDKKVLGKISDFPSIAQKNFVEKVFITIHHDSNVFLSLLEQAQDMGILVRVIPQGFDLTTGDFSKYNIGFIPVLEYSDRYKTRRQAGKRLFDFVIALAALIFLFPVFAVVSLFISLDSPGCPFYFSRRYGKNGKIFHMYKFRSMYKDADKTIDKLREHNEADGPIFKMRKDPRVTRIGCFLRRYSLDELPQIFNVLKGDMSLVGPRPLPIDQIEREDLRQLKRLGVKPGITGLWQIRGRSDISFQRLVKWDIWYINNWSFWLDLNIILQTIPVVLKGRGAY